ncbi:MAG: ABC transporter permease [Gemmatimonadota bacterium]|nr:MAG: ABC transporter permease [Gemmatimonadota bacterium]
MDEIWQDIKYAIRSLRRGGALIAIAVLSLAIGIAANTTIFSAVDVFMLRPLPYPDSDELYSVYTTNRERGWTRASFSVPDFADLRERSRTLDVAATRYMSFNLSEGDRPERLSGVQVSSNFFRMLGVQPARGRAFTAEEETEGRHHVAIISDGLWQRRFGGDPEVLGRVVLLDSEPHTIVGVMPPKFWFLRPGTEIWVPFYITGEEHRNSHYIGVRARLRPGATPEQAQVEAERIAGQLAAEYPDTNTGKGAVLITLHRDVFNEGFRTGSLTATVAVLFLLLIACANVANLLLTHSAGREREVAVRTALGADRARIVRQFLAEALTLSVAGAILGLGLSVFGIRGLLSVMPGWFPRIDEIGLNPRVLGFTALVTMLSAILVGLAPALQSTKANMVESLKEGGRGGTAAKGARLRKVLVVVEVSLALVLLVSSALLVRGFINIRLAERGFDENDVLAFMLALPEEEYPDSASTIAFHTGLRERLSSLPGVRSVGATSILPLHGSSGTYYWLPGEDIESDQQRKITNTMTVSPGYFEALDIPVLQGRVIEDRDRPAGNRVVVVNEAMVERHWPGENPIGRELVVYSGPKQIVGVVADVYYSNDVQSVGPMVYFSAYQGNNRYLDWVIETDVPPERLVETVRQEVLAIDPNLPAYSLRPLKALIDENLGGDTIMAKIMGVVALIALVLALGGVYGVMAYSVSQRTQEMGIRMALGAQYGDVVSMVMRQGALLALLGVVLGVAIALGVTRTLAIFLYGVSPFDPLTFAAAALALLVAGIVATFFPARRAMLVDPIVALRAE